MIATCPVCARSFGSQAALEQHTAATHANPNWNGHAKPTSRKVPLECPACGRNPAFSIGKFGIKAECCGLWSWGYKPLVSRETHRARILAHDAFDRLWKSGTIGRGECYRRLQVAMGMSSAECHIAQMTEAQALRVVEIVRSGQLLSLGDTARQPTEVMA